MNEKGGFSPRRTLALCTIAYASTYLARQNLSIAAPLLTSEGYMTVMEIGLMGSLFFMVYAAGQFINGYIGDILSPKKMLIGGLAVIAATNLAISFLPPAIIIISLWGLNALAQSTQWGPSLRIVNEAYQGSSRSRLAAVVLSTSIGIGSLAAIGLSSLLVKIGLRPLFAVPGLTIAAICVLIISLPNSDRRPIRSDWRKTLHLFKKKDIQCVLFPAFAHGMIKENLVLWTPLLFLKMYDIDLTSAVLFVFMMPSAMLLGRVIYPAVERLSGGNERVVSVFAFGFCSLCLVPFFLLKLPVTAAAVFLAMAMLGLSIINVAFMAVTPMRYGENGQVSMTAGLLNSTSYIGSAAGSALFAFVISKFGHVPMIGIYIVICIASIGSMLPLIIKKAQQEEAIICQEKQH